MPLKVNNRIFLDTNILVGDFLYRNPQYDKTTKNPNAIHAYNALRTIRKSRKHRTYIASFSLPRLASLLQGYKVPKSLVIQELEDLLQRNSIVGLSAALIQVALDDFKHDKAVKDVEDALQFVVCRDNNCYTMLTANTKDFKNVFNVDVKHPSQYRSIAGLV